MKTATRLTTSDRNRALARLRAVTTGTAIASVAAVAGFGSLAAMTKPGTQPGTLAPTVGGTLVSNSSAPGSSAPGSGASGTATPTSGTSNSDSTTSGFTATPTPAFAGSTTTITNVAGPAMITTGGS